MSGAPALPAPGAGMSRPGEVDLYLLGEGRHERLWEQLGGHPLETTTGARFAVWAPNARAVSVVGDWNYWSQDADPLEPQAVSGVWAGCRAERARGAGVQVLRAGRGRRDAPQGRPDRVPCRAAAEDRVRPVSLAALVARRRLARAARSSGAARDADVGLRGPRRARGGRARLARPRRAADAARGRARVHPRRADAGDAASVRAVVGVPGERLLRTARAARRAGRPSCARRRAARGGDRRAAGLGPGALPA